MNGFFGYFKRLQPLEITKKSTFSPQPELALFILF